MTISAVCFFCGVISMFACARAETIILRNGERIEGTIVKETPKYVKVQTSVGETIYFKSTIQSIDQKDIGARESSDPQASQSDVAFPPLDELAQSAERAQPAEENQPHLNPETVQEPPAHPDSGVSSEQAPFKTLKILYEITEKDQQTERSFSSVVYIDRQGNRRRSDLTEIFQPGQLHAKRDEITILDGAQCYFFDMAKGVASVVEIPQQFSAWIDSGNESLREEDAIAQQKVAGKKCFVYKNGDVQSWVWQGITLKRIEKNELTYKRFEAIRIEEDVPFSDDLFAVPESIKAQMGGKHGVTPEAPSVVESAVRSEDVAPVPVERKQEPDSIREVAAPASSEVSSALPPKKAINKTLAAPDHDSDTTATISPDDFRALKQGGEGALEALTKIDLNNIETGLELYRVDTGAYPSTGQGLRALISSPSKMQDWQGPYLAKEPRDPWGNAYVYQASARKGFELYSKGPDGKAHTQDDIVK